MFAAAEGAECPAVSLHGSADRTWLTASSPQETVASRRRRQKLHVNLLSLFYDFISGSLFVV